MATFTNQATLTYRGNTVNSNIVTGEIIETLSVDKTALTATYDANGNIVYVVNFTNSGTTALNNLTFTDDLGAYNFGAGNVTPLTYVNGTAAYYVNGVRQAAPTVADTDPLTLTGISLPAGTVGTLVYQTNVNEFAPVAAGGTINNTASFTGGGLAEAVTDTETVTASSAPRLDITKAVTPATVGPNGQLTYTLTVLNYGNTATVAGDNVQIVDTFDPILDNVTVTYNGAALVAGTDYTYDSTTGLFTTVADRITVPAATYTQDPASGAYSVTPGAAVVTVTGTVAG